MHLIGGIVTYATADYIHCKERANSNFENRPGNPSYTAEELTHQLKLTKAALILAHPACQTTVFAAVKASGLSDSRIVFLRDAPSQHIPTFDSLIAFSEKSTEKLEERRFSSGEARSALAFLSLSSGTTGMYV